MNGPVVMKVLGLAGAVTHQDADAMAGQWIESYDPEANMGHGEVVTTDTLAHAKVWANGKDAMVEWRTVPRIRRIRPDGKPNRPLTAFTIEILPLALAAGEPTPEETP